MLSVAAVKRPPVDLRAVLKIAALHCWIVGYWRIVVSRQIVWRSAWNAAPSVFLPEMKTMNESKSSVTLKASSYYLVYCIYLV